MKKRLIEIFVMIVGTFLFALAVNLFIIPNELGEGGVTGITIITYYLYGWSPGLINLILNGILLIVGYRFLSKHTIVYTIIATLFISFFLHITMGWNIASDEIIINTIFGGVFGGIGIGLVIRSGGTTAGTTILASITHKYLGWNISYGLLFFDLIIVFASYFVIGAEKLLLTIMMLYIATKVMEFTIEGLNTRKAITIISTKSDAIAQQVNDVMERGVTVYSGHGYYTKQEKDILYIVISNREVIKLKKIVQAIDRDAFIAIHDVRDVFGEGFREISKP